MTAMQIKTSTENNKATIAMSGRFDFSSHRQFRDTLEQIMQIPEIREIEVDLGAVDYLDSSALGMLLLMREKISGTNKALALTNCRGVVQQVLEVANFSKLFTIR